MEKVLVIEDCEELREVVGDILEDAGFDVVMATSPECVDEACAQNRFTAIICDLVLPVTEYQELDQDGESVMVGVHMVHKLSRRFPAVPIVVMSGKLVGTPLQTMQQFGARAVLSKPFGRDELLDTLDRVLERDFAGDAP
jgi:CheY-like chemotaxis protein